MAFLRLQFDLIAKWHKISENKIDTFNNFKRQKQAVCCANKFYGHNGNIRIFATTVIKSICMLVIMLKCDHVLIKRPYLRK